LIRKSICFVLLMSILCILLTSCNPLSPGMQLVFDKAGAPSDTEASDVYINAVKNAKGSVIPMGSPVVFTNSECGLSHEVRFVGVHVASDLKEAGIDSRFIADNFVDDAESPPAGQDLLIIDVQITKVVQGTPNEYITDPEQLEEFSLSNGFILNSEFESCASEMIGFVQPEESRLPDENKIFFTNISNEGDTIDCQLVYLADSSVDYQATLFALYDGRTTTLAALAQ